MTKIDFFKKYLRQTIVIFALFASSHLAFSQQQVQGTVSSADDGEALPGATVQIKGTNTGTITDMNGQFRINADPGDVLVVSFVGFIPQEITVGNQTTFNIQLELDMVTMDEVVVVGYGSVRKSDLTGSVSSVKSEDLIKVPNADPVQALQGKVSGLQVINTSGDPGASPVIRLRGVTTLNDNSPIFVVDGVIIEEGNSLDFLNANDIESVEVLKDASATAIFGSRGSNGVIIVTTKRGQKGDVRINLNAEVGFENVDNPIDVMNGREFAQYVNDIEPGTFNNLDALPNVNWQDQIFQENAPIQSYTISLGSATDKIDYYFSLGYFNQQGVIEKSGFERITSKINTTYKLTENFELGLNLSVALKEKQNAPGVINSSLRSWPIEEPFNSDGSFAEVQGAGNPLAAIEYTNSETNSVESVGNLYAAYSFFDGFTVKTSFQFSAGLNKTKSFTPQFFVAPLQQNETSDISQSYSDNTFLLWENTIAYDKEFGVHRINAVAGYTAQEVRSEFLNGSAQNLLREDESFWYINASDGDPLLQNVSNSGGRSAITSILFRANYSLLDKYLFTVTGRRDGSSKFGANNRYGFFPSVAVGWNIADEDFFPKVSFISDVKFRGSWGIVGNDKIPSIAQFSLISSGINGVLGQNDRLVAGATFDGGGNPDLKWEETEQINFGLNIGFFDNRLISEVDYYVKTTNDILVPLEPVGYSGIGAFRSIFYNVATVENKGFEFNVNWRDEIGDFNYSLGFLGSTLKNEVLNLGENIGADSVITAGNLGNGQQISRTVVGRPIGFFLGYKVAGVIQNQGNLDNLPTLPGQGIGDFLYEDTNGDGVLNADDRVQIGNSIPSFIYGFNAQFGWKNFTVSADFQGQRGSEIYNGKQAIRFALLNYEDKFNNRWTGEGSTNEHPRASQGGVNFTQSDYFIESGDYLRLRTLTINYDIPAQVLEKIKIQAARVYVRGTNLFTITEFSGFSPDIGASNALNGVIDLGVYPITRIYSLGLNMTF